jgi:DNA-binding SARP family transcriptional activator
LGPPSITLPDSAEGPPPGIKGLALLAYLILEPGAHTRDELATLLWGESPETAARGSLRQVLLLIRQNLGEVLRVDRQTVELVDPPECDVIGFLQTVEHDPAEAVKLEIPRFLSGFSLRDAPAFDDWAERRRRDLIQRFQKALRSLAEQSMSKSRWREAIGWAERWLASDPLSDQATRVLIEALYLSGDRAGSLARFQEYRDRLRRELDSEASGELLSLAKRIESDVRTGAPKPADTPTAPAEPAFETPLVGRETQWAALLEAWNGAAAGGGRMVLIEGATGLGKTRLAEEFVRWSLTQGATVARGRGFDPTAGVPYAPVAEALRGLLDAPGLGGCEPEWLAEVTRLVPELRGRFPTLPEPGMPTDAGHQWRLLEGIAQLLQAVASERPTILLIDDAHWCDGESCTLLPFLAGRLKQEPIVLLLTVTPGELDPEAPARRMIQTLRFEGQAAVITLSPLSEPEVWHLIHEMGRIKAPGGGRRFAQKVFELSRGNASYTIELVKTLFAAGVFGATPLSLEWVAWAPDKINEYRPLELPRTIRDSVARRITKLPAPLLELLATVAVAGHGVGADLLAEVHQLSRVRVASILDALSKRELVVEEEGRYRCAHQVIQDVVRHDLTPVSRLELNRALALALATLTPAEAEGDVAGRIAGHADRGGEPGLAHRYALKASQAAATRYAFGEALGWLELAAATARSSEERDEVSHRSTELLQTPGWEPPAGPVKRPGTPVWGIRREDLDLRVVE